MNKKKNNNTNIERNREIDFPICVCSVWPSATRAAQPITQEPTSYQPVCRVSALHRSPKRWRREDASEMRLLKHNIILETEMAECRWQKMEKEEEEKYNTRKKKEKQRKKKKESGIRCGFCIVFVF